MDEPISMSGLIAIATAFVGALGFTVTVVWYLGVLFRRNRDASEEGRRRLYGRMEALSTENRQQFEQFRRHVDENFVHVKVHEAEMKGVHSAIQEMNDNLMTVNGRVCPIQQELQPPPKRG